MSTTSRLTGESPSAQREGLRSVPPSLLKGESLSAPREGLPYLPPSCLKGKSPSAPRESRRANARTLALMLCMATTGAAFAQPPPTGTAQIAPFSRAADAAPPPPWKVVTLPKQPRHTRYDIVNVDGTRVLRMQTDGGYANLLHPLGRAVDSTPILRWRWRVEQHPAGADLTRKEADDMPARLCVLFDLPLDRLSAGERFKVRLGRTLFDPELPAAAICYVWDAALPAGTWLPNAYTGRVQMLVLRSTASGHATGTWFSETRDLRADFARAFAHEARDGYLPPLAAIGVAADGDNTGAAASALVADISLGEAPR